MKNIWRTLVAVMLIGSMAACGDKDNDNDDAPDTVSGATTHEEDMAKGRIGTGTFIDYDGTTVSNAYGIDFNKDGQLEFRISDDRKYVSYVWSENGTLEWDKCAYNTVPSITAFCGED